MAHDDDHADHETQRRRISRRTFLAGGAVVGGTVLWGSANAAEGLGNGGQGFNRPPLLGLIPPNNGTGGTGNTGAVRPNVRSSGTGGGLTGFSVETGLGPIGSNAAPLFRNRFR